MIDNFGHLLNHAAMHLCKEIDKIIREGFEKSRGQENEQLNKKDQLLLGLKYFYGIGVETNYNQSIRWFRLGLGSDKTFDTELVRSDFEIYFYSLYAWGYAYLKQSDYYNAYNVFSRCSVLVFYALKHIFFLDTNKYYYIKECGNGVYACLASMYFEGKGTDKNTDKAIAYIIWAAFLGNNNCIFLANEILRESKETEISCTYEECEIVYKLDGMHSFKYNYKLYYI